MTQKLLNAGSRDKKQLKIIIEHIILYWLAKHQKTDLCSIDTRKHLSEYGLDSIKIVELSTALENEFSTTLPLRNFYEDVAIQVLVESLADYLLSDNDIEKEDSVSQNSGDEVVLPAFPLLEVEY